MKSSRITLKLITNSVENTLSDYILTKCTFCQKHCRLSSQLYTNLYQLSRGGRFFCSFCVRSGLNTRRSNDTLALTFKNVFNQFYYQNHVNLKKMWISQIRDLVEVHKEIGLENPIFSYDDESMNWFIDFSRVGSSKGKLPFREVEKTVVSIVDSLEIGTLIPNISVELFKQKYLNAIELFNIKRYRPKGKVILSPSVGESRGETIVF